MTRLKFHGLTYNKTLEHLTYFLCRNKKLSRRYEKEIDIRLLAILGTSWASTEDIVVERKCKRIGTLC